MTTAPNSFSLNGHPKQLATHETQNTRKQEEEDEPMGLPSKKGQGTIRVAHFNPLNWTASRQPGFTWMCPLTPESRSNQTLRHALPITFRYDDCLLYLIS